MDWACLVAFVRDYQSLLAGLIAIAAAFIAARPVWRQLDRMSVQTNTMFRDFLAARAVELTARQKWLGDHVGKFKQDVERRMYEMRKLEGGLNIEWVFERSQITRGLIATLQEHQAERRDAPAIVSATDTLISTLAVLEDTLDAIHRPLTSDQTDEDSSFTDEEWAAIGREGNAADTALDGVVGKVSTAAERLDQAVSQELDVLRDRIKRTDDALLKRNG